MKSIWETVFKSNEYMLLNYGFVLPKGNSFILFTWAEQKFFKNFPYFKSEHVHLGVQSLERYGTSLSNQYATKMHYLFKNLKMFARQNITFSSFKMQFNLVFNFGTFLILCLFIPSTSSLSWYNRVILYSINYTGYNYTQIFRNCT